MTLIRVRQACQAHKAIQACRACQVRQARVANQFGEVTSRSGLAF